MKPPTRWQRIYWRIVGLWWDFRYGDLDDLPDDPGLPDFEDDYGTPLYNVHDPALCEGRSCVVHNPSEHSMRAFPLSWRIAGPFDIKPSHFERICPHGVGHPDPDQFEYWDATGQASMAIHGCDGCCHS